MSNFAGYSDVGTPHQRGLPRGITKAREQEIIDLFSSLAEENASEVDGSAVAAIDSEGLSLLIKHLTRLQRKGQTVAIKDPSHTLEDARRALRLEVRMPFVDDDQEVVEEPELRDRLGEVLVDLGFVNQEGLDQAVQKASERPDARLGTVLLEDGYVTEEQLAQALARQYSIPYLRPVTHHILDVSMGHGVPFPILRANGLLPLLSFEGVIAVAVRDPSNVYATDALRDHSGMIIVPCVASVAEIEKGLDLLQRTAAARGERTGSAAEFASISVEERLDQLLMDALIEGASDLHVEPGQSGYHVRFRVDGRLRRSSKFSQEDGNSLVARIKVLAECDISEKRLPQDGRVHFKRGERDVDLRVSTLPTVEGEKIVLRVLDRNAKNLGLDELGLEGTNLQWLREGIHEPNGMVLVTGPTGSGKTTTLYSVLDELVSPEVNISTVENPVERAVKGVNQTQVNHKAGLTFAKCLRALLRQDPDILMIGEIRDAETAEIAVEGALTGHLVLATLHTNDSPGAATRLIQMGVEPFLVSATLRTVMAQRLVRRICESCKHEATIPEDVRSKYESFGLGHGPFHAGSGCANCRGQGYEGRLGVFEVLDVDEAMRDVIARNPSTLELQNAAWQSGMTTLLKDGIRYVNEGVTTLEEAIRAGGSAV